ncbi:MAG: glycosyl hydrolase family 28-related protein [Anaerocolumna sp.]
MEHRLINILNYGAKADGKTDCTIPVKKALEDIRKRKKPATLFFPKGEYHFYKEYAEKRLYHTSNTNSLDYPVKEIGILIEEQENLRIDGDGSLFLFHGNMMALAVVKSRQIELCNFSWDFPCATVSEMTIEKIENNRVIYRIPKAQTYEVKNQEIRWYEKSPLTGETYWSFMNQEQVAALVVYHPWDKTAIRYPEEFWPLSNAESMTGLKDQRIQVTYKKVPDCYREGICFEICRNAYRETAGSFIWESDNVQMEGINIHYMHSFGWLIQMSCDISFMKCRFMPRENTGRRTTGFADLIHVSGARGEISIKECGFSNAHDDPINIHGTFTRVVNMPDEYTLLLEYVHDQQGGFRQFYPGNKVIFYARDTLQGVNKEQEYTVVKTEDPIGGDGRSMLVTFAEIIPECLKDKIGAEGKYVAENVTYTPSVLIKNCYFESIPTRGILCTSRKKVVIEENEFHSINMSAIYISNDSNEWYESGPVRDMEIRNNRFYIIKPYDNEPEGKEAICIHPIVKGDKLPDGEYPIHKNIRIHHNIFYIPHERVLSAENVEDLHFYDNKIFWSEECSGKELMALSFNHCKNTEVNDNEFVENPKMFSFTIFRTE